jgi:hypothetical protein
MPDPWFPGAIVDLGINAGYARGHNNMALIKLHYTVGTDSRALIRNKGLAQWLMPKTGPPIQFAEADAYCFDSGPYNDDGPGIEWERLPTGEYERPGLQLAEPLTVDQTEWGGRLLHWLHDEWGVPLELYAGPRFQATATGFRGSVNHGDLDDQRSDGVTRAEWDAMTGDVMTQEQMDTLGRWMQEQSANVEKKILDTVGAWLVDQRAYMDKKFAELKK